MKSIKLFLLCFLLFFQSLASAQEKIIRQEEYLNKAIQFDMVDVTDGFTAETGLVPTSTCTLLRPLGASFASCINAITEVGSGKYRLVLSEREIQNLGRGAIYITNAAARPVRIDLSVLGSNKAMFDGSEWMKSPSNLNNTSWWTKTGATVTEDTTADYLGDSIGDTLTGDGANSRHMVSFALPTIGGSGEIYMVADVKSGTLNNAWVGDNSASHIWGVDLNTSTGAVTPNVDGRLRGWKVEQLANSWYRIHLLATERSTSAAAHSITVALGNGTGSDNAPIFTSSGTMVFARVQVTSAENIRPDLYNAILPSLQTAASTTSVTLAGTDPTGTDLYKNREICFSLGFVASSYGKAYKNCSCITAYNGVTKVAALYPALDAVPTSGWKYKVGGVCPAVVNANVTTMATDSLSAAAVSDGAAAKIGATVPTDINMGR